MNGQLQARCAEWTRGTLRGLSRLGVDFYTGVPDSLLQPLNDDLLAAEYGLTGAHVVVANEGGAVGLAPKNYMATGHPAMVYLQKTAASATLSTPWVSLLNHRVYGILRVCGGVARRAVRA